MGDTISMHSSKNLDDNIWRVNVQNAGKLLQPLTPQNKAGISEKSQVAHEAKRVT
jgi:hypothetical protein